MTITYERTQHTSYIEVEMDDPEHLTSESRFQIFDTDQQADEWQNRHGVLCKVIKMIKGYCREMENYTYFGSNPGVPEDDFEDLAVDILKERWRNYE